MKKLLTVGLLSLAAGCLAPETGNIPLPGSENMKLTGKDITIGALHYEYKMGTNYYVRLDITNYVGNASAPTKAKGDAATSIIDSTAKIASEVTKAGVSSAVEAATK